MAVTQKDCVPTKKKAKGWDAQKDSLCQTYFEVRDADDFLSQKQHSNFCILIFVQKNKTRLKV